MTLGDFYDMLAAHDWFHEFSDDHEVFLKGQSALAKLRSLAAETPAHQALFDHFESHNRVPPQNTKPERPTKDT